MDRPSLFSKIIDILLWPIDALLSLFGCRIGYHQWMWNLQESNEAGLRIDGSIPPFARCVLCGKQAKNIPSL